jgi:hypothetical protein
MIQSAYLMKKLGLWSALRAAVPQRLRTPLQSLLLRSRDTLHVDPEDRAFLVDYYRADVERLATLLNRDFSNWLKVNPDRQPTASV